MTTIKKISLKLEDNHVLIEKAAFYVFTNVNFPTEISLKIFKIVRIINSSKKLMKTTYFVGKT